VGNVRGRHQCRLLYDLLKPHVVKVIVCDPRKNALLKTGNKNDRVDARKLSHLLHAGLLTPVYHGESGVRTLRELARSYLTLTKDLTRVMNRLKALYRSWAIPVWVKKFIPRATAAPGWSNCRKRACVAAPSSSINNSISCCRSGATPDGSCCGKAGSIQPMSFCDRFPAGAHPGCPSDRSRPDTASFPYQATTLAYCGLALQTRSSGEYRFIAGQLQRSNRLPALRGLNTNHNMIEECVQERSHAREYLPGCIGRFLSKFAGQRNETGHGAPDFGAQDGGDCFNRWKKGAASIQEN